MSLMASKNTNFIDEKSVTAVPEPEFTKTWHPMSHEKVIHSLEKAFSLKGLDLPTEDKRKYSLTSNGNDMFGVWDIPGGQEKEMGWSIGIRNSMQKTFAVGICAGNTVFVCDNLVFDGKFIEFLKHTGRLTEGGLLDMSSRAIDGVINRLSNLTKWHVKLKEIDLEEQNFKVLTYNAMVNGVFPPSKFSEFIKCYDEENKVSLDTAETLYAFHGAATRLMRSATLFNVSNRSVALSKSCNNYIEIAESPRKASKFKKLLDIFSL